MKLLVRSFLLILACLMAFATTACRGDDDDDDSADGDADSDADSDSDGDSDGDGDSDSDGDGDADLCVGENTDETCDDGQDNNANDFTDCTDNCCRHNAAVTVCDAVDPTPIQDIRNGEVSDGDQVLVENMIVTGIDRETSWYMQSADAEGADLDFTGIFVFVPDSNPDDITIPAIGDIINLRGEVDDFFGLAELTFVTDPEVVSTGAMEPVAATPEEIGDEDGEAGARAEALESVLVQVQGFVTNLAPEPGDQDNAPTNEFAIGAEADGDDLLRVDDHSFELDPMPAMGDHVTIIGNLRFNHGHFALEPRSQDDLTIE